MIGTLHERLAAREFSQLRDTLHRVKWHLFPHGIAYDDLTVETKALLRDVEDKIYRLDTLLDGAPDFSRT